MRIAIVGAFGSGKTTLTLAAAKGLGLPVATIPAMESPYASPGKHATDCTPAELIELLVRRVLDRGNSEAPENIVSDGSLLHDWVFVKTLLAHGANPTDLKVLARDEVPAGLGSAWEALTAVLQALKSRMGSQYTQIVHLPIEFSMVPGRAPISENFRIITDVYLLEELAALDLPYAAISGSPEDRLAHLTALTTVSR